MGRQTVTDLVNHTVSSNGRLPTLIVHPNSCLGLKPESSQEWENQI